jgi:transposase
VLVADEAGEELLAATFAHEEQGLRALCGTLVRLKVELVAIERPDGLLVERLLDAGLRVLALHPNQVAAARPRFRVSGGKSDRFDAFVLCELARTDSHRFRVLEPDSDETKALRALTRAREDLVHAKVALTNQLRSELERFWPGPIGLFTKLDSAISLAFGERYPSPVDARGLGEQRLAAFLARQHYPGGQKPAQLLAKLRRAPEGRVGEAELNARRQLVLGLVATLKTLIAQVKRLERQIATAVRAHPRTVRSSSRCSRIPTVSSRPPSCWPRSATAARATRPATRSPATPARPRSRSSPASAKRRAFAGAATSGCEEPCARCPTAHATGTLGRKTATPPPEPAATTIPVRCAASAAPGAASYGAAGKTASPTTRPATAACSSTSRSRFPPRRGPAPTSLPLSGWPAPPSPTRRPNGPSAKRLTASRHPLTHSGLDTGRLLSTDAGARWGPIARWRTPGPRARAARPRTRSVPRGKGKRRHGRFSAATSATANRRFLHRAIRAHWEAHCP